MERIIAACGLVCSECPAYEATKAGDAEAIGKVAQEWSEMFHADVKPEHVWCDGCMTDGPRKCHHTTECEVRACVAGRGLRNCAVCPDYGCETLTAFFEMAPPPRESLEALRAGR